MINKEVDGAVLDLNIRSVPEGFYVPTNLLCFGFFFHIFAIPGSQGCFLSGAPGRHQSETYQELCQQQKIKLTKDPTSLLLVSICEITKHIRGRESKVFLYMHRVNQPALQCREGNKNQFQDEIRISFTRN